MICGQLFCQTGPVVPGDVEKGSKSVANSNLGEILPVYRQDSHLAVQSGSHEFPGEGTYQLKFDNSYSLWRNKTLYYRVYYSAWGINAYLKRSFQWYYFWSYVLNHCIILAVVDLCFSFYPSPIIDQKMTSIYIQNAFLSEWNHETHDTCNVFYVA